MNVLSLFDGMSCGQLALKRSGIKVDKYYASEIDKYAISIAKKNFPNTIHLGDVTKIDISKLDRIDMIIGGSPCQSFSNASMTKLNFEDPRGKLFFEFVKLVQELKPKYFLLENVKMKKEWQDVISHHLGVEPIEINSSLLSAQHRRRLYWTNIPNVTVPSDKGIMLKDILEYGFVDRDKSYCIDANYSHGINPLQYVKKARRQIVTTEKGLDFVKKVRASKNGLIQVGSEMQLVRVRKHEVEIQKLQKTLRLHKDVTEKTLKQISNELNVALTKVEHWFRTDNSFAIPSEDIWLDLKKCLGIQTNYFDKQILEFETREGVYESASRVYDSKGKHPTLTTSVNGLIQVGIAKDINGHDSLKRVYSEEGKAPTVNAHGGGNTEPKVATNFNPKEYGLERSDWRKLTPLECERLQTVDDNYTEGVSNSQRYKMIGNGWTVDVIKHIFKGVAL